MQYGAKILNLPEPKEIKLDQIESEMLKAFYNDSKKVSNKKAKEFFKLSQLGILIAIGVIWWSHKYINIAVTTFNSSFISKIFN